MRTGFEFRPCSGAPEDYAAVQAWVSLPGQQTQPSSLEILSDRKGRGPSHKSEVFRLGGIPGLRGHVIAKRADRKKLQLERFVYLELLRTLPVPSLHCFGYWEEPDDDIGWLFIEEAAGSAYDESDPVHRAVASRWVGQFHASSASAQISRQLPRFDVSRYFAYLESARRDIADIASGRTSNEAHTVLERIRGECDAVEAHWHAIEAICQDFPQCAVHGDFIKKNVRVGERRGERTLLVMDWETAGWGSPVEDIAGLDVDSYLHEVRDVWSHLDAPSIRRAEVVGRVFRTLAWIAATTRWLGSESADWAIADLAEYGQFLSGALVEVDIGS